MTTESTIDLPDLWLSDRQGLEDRIIEWVSSYTAELRAENERLRAALRQAEWAPVIRDESTGELLHYCPTCGNNNTDSNHHPDCPIHLALKP